MSSVRLVYRKFDGSLHWNYAVTPLGEDEYGRWVGATTGTDVFRGTTRTGPVDAPHVLLLPRDAWWTACFNAAPHRTEIYCDIATVPHWADETEITAIDLDLDVIRRRTGEVILVDEDEFAAHQVKYDYPADVVAEARASAEWLLAAVGGRVEPFGARYRHWLDQVA
jgi:protein associated with RNAse G/E